MPGLSALPRLAAAVKDSDEATLSAIKDRFENHNGRIVESYFPAHTNACLLLVERNGNPDGGREAEKPYRRLMVWMDRRDIAMRHPPFIAAYWRTIWLARRAEHESKNVLTQRTRNLCLDMLFDVAVLLLGTVDSIASTKDETTVRLERTSLVATADLDRVEKFAERGAIHRTFARYLLGLPAGIMLLALPVYVMEQHLRIAQSFQHLITLCIIGGGIGAIASVMVRITRGQNLSVDVNQGGVVTFLAGAFRPVIGAVFGVALYALLEGGLLPLTAGEQQSHFFGGLSFLAGFSERWAQDMIVRSAPIAPSPASATGQTSKEAGSNLAEEQPPHR
ncbi:hypothetical protein Aab01nite_65270 [Paractinoplanes abujensis]|uniref:Uncharacterized protein n=1 Tax=Paractinoplanes abujensis TaxID=882441 RepID=A0A7W7CPX1_9ACTN|nr:hypothetical protein [Actinoplanes abujensis]MBB4692564.1 hypothetical protein [Actinoplanes abujensis]GID22937.1 hypothetical protein Aab01nite_65270 [Actinoplanes abujensis]